MRGKSSNELIAEMKIGSCAEYGNYLFDLLREEQKSSCPCLIFVSRTGVSAHDLLTREGDIKERISSCISEGRSEELVRLLSEIENVVRLVSKGGLQRRPLYMSLQRLIYRA